MSIVNSASILTRKFPYGVFVQIEKNRRCSIKRLTCATAIRVRSTSLRTQMQHQDDFRTQMQHQEIELCMNLYHQQSADMGKLFLDTTGWRPLSEFNNMLLPRMRTLVKNNFDFSARPIWNWLADIEAKCTNGKLVTLCKDVAVSEVITEEHVFFQPSPLPFKAPIAAFLRNMCDPFHARMSRKYNQNDEADECMIHFYVRPAVQIIPISTFAGKTGVLFYASKGGGSDESEMTVEELHYYLNHAMPN